LCCFEIITDGDSGGHNTVEIRDEAYQRRALRRRKSRRVAAMDPMSATDRSRLGGDRSIATGAIRSAILHIASAGPEVLLDDITGFRSEDDYLDMVNEVQASFGDVSEESARHIESILLRACSTDDFWNVASKLLNEELVEVDLEQVTASIPLPPGLFQEANRVSVGDPHTQVVIGPLFTPDTLAFSVYPIYKTGRRGSNPIRISVGELARESGQGTASWSAGWNDRSLVFSSSESFIRFSHDQLVERWSGPKGDRGDIAAWTVMSD